MPNAAAELCWGKGDCDDVRGSGDGDDDDDADGDGDGDFGDDDGYGDIMVMTGA